MNWFSVIAQGLMTGVAWGLIKKSRYAKYVFVGLLTIALIGMFTIPGLLQHSDVEIYEFITGLVAFLFGSAVGESYYKEWFA